MGTSNMLFYLLYGVAGIGVLLALIVLISALVQRGLERREEAAGPVGDDPIVSGHPSNVAEEQPEEAPAMPVRGKKPPREEPDGLPLTGNQQEMPQTAVKTPVKADKKPVIAQPEGKTKAAQADVKKEQMAVEGLEREEMATALIGDLTLRACSAKHIGSRKEQQDALYHSAEEVAAKSGFLAVVCDGMGGMRMGGEAAQMAAKAFVEGYLASDKPVQEALQAAAEQANEKVWELCKADDLTGAGTTLIAALVTKEGFRYISVGDSHIYLLRRGVLSQLNVDHNYLSELLQKVRRGEITREQALSDPERAHLTSYLGMKKLSLIDRSTSAIEMEDGDRILLASDGLFKVLTPADIADKMKDFDEDTPARLIGEVLKYNYRNQDNIAVTVLAVDKTSMPDGAQ